MLIIVGPKITNVEKYKETSTKMYTPFYIGELALCRFSLNSVQAVAKEKSKCPGNLGFPIDLKNTNLVENVDRVQKQSTYCLSQSEVNILVFRIARKTQTW